MKMSGVDFKAFIGSKDPAWWPEGLYIEDELLRVNGEEAELGNTDDYKDTDLIEIVGGALAWDSILKDREMPPGSLKALARRWLKAQNETRVVIAVPNERVDELAALLKAIGARVCT